MKKALLIITALLILFGGAAGCEKQPVKEPEFNFIFKYGVTGRNTLDTFEETFSQDMVMDPSITIPLPLSGEEMESIHRKMVEIDFFNYPDKFSVSVPAGEFTREVTPYSTYFFRVEYGNKIKELLWHDKIMNPDKKAEKLRELINLIRNIIVAKEEYKKLPEPKGGYI